MDSLFKKLITFFITFFKKLITFFITFFMFLLNLLITAYDKSRSFWRRRELKELENDEDVQLKYPSLPKSEAIFYEYVKNVEEPTTNDIADFYTVGVGKELIDKTIKS